MVIARRITSADCLPLLTLVLTLLTFRVIKNPLVDRQVCLRLSKALGFCPPIYLQEGYTEFKHYYYTSSEPVQHALYVDKWSMLYLVGLECYNVAYAVFNL